MSIWLAISISSHNVQFALHCKFKWATYFTNIRFCSRYKWSFILKVLSHHKITQIQFVGNLKFTKLWIYSGRRLLCRIAVCHSNISMWILFSTYIRRDVWQVIKIMSWPTTIIYLHSLLLWYTTWHFCLKFCACKYDGLFRDHVRLETSN